MFIHGVNVGRLGEYQNHFLFWDLTFKVKTQLLVHPKYHLR